MGIQTPVDKAAATSPTTTRTTLGRLGNDILTLLQLQTNLFRLDIARSASRTKASAACLVVAGAIGVAGVTTMLAGLGAWIQAELHWPMSLSLASAGAAATLVSIGILTIGVVLASSLGNAFQHSSEELQRNIETIKSSLGNE